jgi:hypothetical protein
VSRRRVDRDVCWRFGRRVWRSVRVWTASQDVCSSVCAWRGGCRGCVVRCRGVFCLGNCMVLYVVRILVSIVVSIPACHAGDPGSIPGREAFAFFCRAFLLARYTALSALPGWQPAHSAMDSRHCCSPATKVSSSPAGLDPVASWERERMSSRNESEAISHVLRALASPQSAGRWVADCVRNVV